MDSSLSPPKDNFPSFLFLLLDGSHGHIVLLFLLGTCRTIISSSPFPVGFIVTIVSYNLRQQIRSSTNKERVDKGTLVTARLGPEKAVKDQLAAKGRQFTSSEITRHNFFFERRRVVQIETGIFVSHKSRNIGPAFVFQIGDNAKELFGEIFMAIFALVVLRGSSSGMRCGLSSFVGRVVCSMKWLWLTGDTHDIGRLLGRLYQLLRLCLGLLQKQRCQ